MFNLVYDVYVRLLVRCENKMNFWEFINVVFFVCDVLYVCIVINKMVMIVVRNVLVSVLLNILYLILFIWCILMVLR